MAAWRWWDGGMGAGLGGVWSAWGSGRLAGQGAACGGLCRTCGGAGCRGMGHGAWGGGMLWARLGHIAQARLDTPNDTHTGSELIKIMVILSVGMCATLLFTAQVGQSGPQSWMGGGGHVSPPGCARLGCVHRTPRPTGLTPAPTALSPPALPPLLCPCRSLCP